PRTGRLTIAEDANERAARVTPRCRRTGAQELLGVGARRLRGLRAAGHRPARAGLSLSRRQAVPVRLRMDVLLQLHTRAGQSVARHLVVVAGDRLPKGFHLGLPDRGPRDGLHERTAWLSPLAAVHRLSALPAPRPHQAGAVSDPAALRGHHAHLARRPSLRRVRRVLAARAGRTTDRRGTAGTDRRAAAALRSGRQDDPAGGT